MNYYPPARITCRRILAAQRPLDGAREVGQFAIVACGNFDGWNCERHTGGAIASRAERRAMGPYVRRNRKRIVLGMLWSRLGRPVTHIRRWKFGDRGLSFLPAITTLGGERDIHNLRWHCLCSHGRMSSGDQSDYVAGAAIDSAAANCRLLSKRLLLGRIRPPHVERVWPLRADECR